MRLINSLNVILSSAFVGVSLCGCVWLDKGSSTVNCILVVIAYY